MMKQIQILDTGRIDERESAFPQAVRLPDGRLLCSFGVGGGQYATGGTECAASDDGGKTWTHAGVILPYSHDPHWNNHLKLSLNRDGKTIYAYGMRSDRQPGAHFGEGTSQAVVCTSTDQGKTWSGPQVVPMPEVHALEVSHGILTLPHDRLLAPAATLPAPDRLGETVVVAISNDGGKTWPKRATVFHDPAGKHGYFEHKLADLGNGRIMAVCWTVNMADVSDVTNHFAISNDAGETWSPAHDTGVMGQTMCPVHLGGDRLLVLYNRRRGQPAIVGLIVRFTDNTWQVESETVVFDAVKMCKARTDVGTGVKSFEDFAFGFPTALPLGDHHFLMTHWSVEQGKCGIRWTKLQLIDATHA